MQEWIEYRCQTHKKASLKKRLFKAVCSYFSNLILSAAR
ncbi:MAG TPA: hypothetical protein DEB17_01520 [Chlorobaculum sp.]|uniref:Uncharacterized protein n=1 Tax=Chlorobaculum tepidum (strain ATCC 49652 / DSM 12025 / NBRC 103806 / TLS) TaxID=194439 RepID=Q8KCI8_CHLTE|nr:hypothetical protein CT1433 [Chlorobaculum tepidum TLS]HBU22677.1 hypothetical protein [Chlorobaculum sp.]